MSKKKEEKEKTTITPSQYFGFNSVHRSKTSFSDLFDLR